MARGEPDTPERIELQDQLACVVCHDGGIIVGDKGYEYCPLGGEMCGEDRALMTTDELRDLALELEDRG